jgi:hypothetical protein
MRELTMSKPATNTKQKKTIKYVFDVGFGGTVYPNIL